MVNKPGSVTPRSILRTVPAEAVVYSCAGATSAPYSSGRRAATMFTSVRVRRLRSIRDVDHQQVLRTIGRLRHACAVRVAGRAPAQVLVWALPADYAHAAPLGAEHPRQVSRAVVARLIGLVSVRQRDLREVSLVVHAAPPAVVGQHDGVPACPLLVHGP